MIPEDELNLAPEDEAETAENRVRRRAFDELKKAAAKAAAEAPAAAAGGGAAPRELHVRFRRSPVEVLPGTSTSASGGAAAAGFVRLEENALSGPAGGRKAKGTGKTEDLKAQLILRSIGCDAHFYSSSAVRCVLAFARPPSSGTRYSLTTRGFAAYPHVAPRSYRGQPVPGIPFDEGRAVIPHTMGRVKGVEGPGAAVYCNGWIKRGPSGIIGSNLIDAEETVAMVEEDVKSGAVAAGEAKGGVDGLRKLLRERKVRAAPERFLGFGMQPTTVECAAPPRCCFCSC